MQISVLIRKFAMKWVKEIIYFFLLIFSYSGTACGFLSLSISQAALPASSCLYVSFFPLSKQRRWQQQLLHVVLGRNRCKPLTSYAKAKFLCYRQGEWQKQEAVFYGMATAIPNECSQWDLLLRLHSQVPVVEWTEVCGALELPEHPCKLSVWLLGLDPCRKF